MEPLKNLIDELIVFARGLIELPAKARKPIDSAEYLRQFPLGWSPKFGVDKMPLKYRIWVLHTRVSRTCQVELTE